MVAASKKKEAEKAKAKAKAKAKKGDNDDYNASTDEDEEAYNAPSKSFFRTGAAAKPPNGSFEKCARCTQQFTVVCTVLARSCSGAVLIISIDAVYNGCKPRPRLSLSQVRKRVWCRSVQETYCTTQTQGTG